MKSGCFASYRVYGAPQPLQAAPFFPCQTRFMPQRSQMSNLFIVAPQFSHEYLRLPPLAVFSMGSATAYGLLSHSGRTTCADPFALAGIVSVHRALRAGKSKLSRTFDIF